MIYSIEFGPNQALVEADDEQKAETKAVRLFGLLHGPFVVSRATDDDIAWVKAMGGVVHA